MDVIQGTPEWHTARLGRLTSSRIADATARTKTGWGASRDNYMAELVLERITGLPFESYKSAAMDWGSQCEPDARMAYEFLMNEAVTQVGFVPHPKIDMAGASPDGLVGNDGLVEFKCPTTKTHIDTLLGASIDGGYIKQMQFQMACTDRQWCDFVSFDPRMPPAMRLHVQRVNRDPAMIIDLEKQAAEFLAELSAKVSELSAKYLKEAA